MATEVVWINGAYGAGKTTVAARLVELVPAAVRFDPELLGSMLRRLPELPQPDDFQDLPLWRGLVVSTVTTMLGQLDRPLIVPMTVVDSRCYRETIGVLGARFGLDCYFLDVSAEVLVDRITTQVQFPDDPARDEAARRWRLKEIPHCIQARASLPAEVISLDGTLPPDELARQIARHSGLLGP
ncbi:MAG: AAA family ATPase [Jatrophihabitantaceae bacterium]